jgi:uncharacterized protein (TIGR03435 family)
VNYEDYHEIQEFSSSRPNLRMIAWNAKSLIMEAYNLMGHEVVYPSTNALTPDHYDIAAKAEGDPPRTRLEFRPTLQSLLADRFQLKFHREMRKLPVYFLVVGKNGPSFREIRPARLGAPCMAWRDANKPSTCLSPQWKHWLKTFIPLSLG